jgi:hypothetical protein
MATPANIIANPAIPASLNCRYIKETTPTAASRVNSRTKASRKSANRSPLYRRRQHRRANRVATTTSRNRTAEPTAENSPLVNCPRAYAPRWVATASTRTASRTSPPLHRWHRCPTRNRMPRVASSGINRSPIPLQDGAQPGGHQKPGIVRQEYPERLPGSGFPLSNRNGKRISQTTRLLSLVNKVMRMTRGSDPMRSSPSSLKKTEHSNRPNRLKGTRHEYEQVPPHPYSNSPTWMTAPSCMTRSFGFPSALPGAFTTE